MNKSLRLLCAAFLLLLTSCMPVPSSVAEDGYMAQIIIKFSDAAINPADNSFVDGLSREAGAQLRYVRPMSGTTHVFEVRGLRDEAELQEVLMRLAKQPGVSYAEEDRMRRKQ